MAIASSVSQFPTNFDNFVETRLGETIFTETNGSLVERGEHDRLIRFVLLVTDKVAAQEGLRSHLEQKMYLDGTKIGIISRASPNERGWRHRVYIFDPGISQATAIGFVRRLEHFVRGLGVVDGRDFYNTEPEVNETDGGIWMFGDNGSVLKTKTDSLIHPEALARMLGRFFGKSTETPRWSPCFPGTHAEIGPSLPKKQEETELVVEVRGSSDRADRKARARANAAKALLAQPKGPSPGADNHKGRKKSRG